MLQKQEHKHVASPCHAGQGDGGTPARRQDLGPGGWPSPLPSSTGFWRSNPLVQSTPLGWRSSQTCCHQSLKGKEKQKETKFIHVPGHLFT